MHALHTLVIAALGFIAGILFELWVNSLCTLGKRADEARSQALIEYCTRQAPHVCKENGPCNGWPKDRDPNITGTFDPK